MKNGRGRNEPKALAKQRRYGEGVDGQAAELQQPHQEPGHKQAPAAP